MSYSQYPSSAPEQQSTQTTTVKKSNNSNKIVVIALAAALLLSIGYIIYDKSKSNELYAQLQTQFTNVDSARSELQNSFNEASKKLDELNGQNISLQGQLAEKNADIEKKKNEIASILRNKNATAAQLSKAKGLIAELNGQIQDLMAQVEQLKQENQTLTTANTTLTSERDNLQTEKQKIQEDLSATEAAKKNVEDVASTLHASNISIAAINVKGSGKEVSTSTAKRADLMRIGFDIDENRIAPSGTKEVYVVVTAPDGTPVTTGETFTTREEGDKKFTSKVNVNYEQGKRIPVTFDWKQGTKYQTGEYKIEIYHNGYKIGEGRKALKKGGLFS
jgi:peptidoglycan hydrolase CwlO-like protein